MGNLFSGFFGVIHRHFGTFFCPSSNSLAHIFPGVVGVLESLLCSICGLHDHGFCAIIHLYYRALGDFYAVLVDFADLYFGFVKYFAGGACDDFRASFEIKTFFRSLMSFGQLL